MGAGGGGVVKPTLDWRVTMFDIHVQSLRSERMQVYLREDCVLDGEGSMIFASRALVVVVWTGVYMTGYSD